MVALPGQLFYSTQIPVCLWFLARNKGKNGFRDRKGEILFIDARNMGYMVDRTRRELSFDPDDPNSDIVKIADMYHAWRGEQDAIDRQGEYEDVAGFCKSAKLEEVREHGYILTPGRYVGAADIEDDGISFEEKMAAYTADLAAQFEESKTLEQKIKENLAKVGYGF
jgi:type I restriction enzyme M protein